MVAVLDILPSKCTTCHLRSGHESSQSHYFHKQPARQNGRSWEDGTENWARNLRGTLSREFYTFLSLFSVKCPPFFSCRTEAWRDSRRAPCCRPTSYFKFKIIKTCFSPLQQVPYLSNISIAFKASSLTSK